MNRLNPSRIDWRLPALLCAFVALPYLAGDNRFAAFIVGIAMINILYAMGMNLLYGYTGLLPLMFAGIAGLSAYSTVGLVMRAGWSFWAAMPLSAVGAALVGVLLGLPALRLRSFYFILSGLVIQTAVSLAFLYFAGLTNGDTGIAQIPRPDLPFVSGATLSDIQFEILLAVVAWLGVAALWIIIRSRLGEKLVAIREDEVLAGAMGVDVVYYKLIAFFISSLYAAVAGALYASFAGFVSPRNFDLLISVNIWLMVALGGKGTIRGPIVGALLLTPLPFILLRYDLPTDILYGILIIVVITLLPEGLFPRHGRRNLLLEAPKRLFLAWARK
jgi:branched-chain amino acid transport system permease protein